MTQNSIIDFGFIMPYVGTKDTLLNRRHDMVDIAEMVEDILDFRPVVGC